jgi:hypothetical protein
LRPGPECRAYYELFVIIDIYSRYIVGWTVVAAETGELAEAFIADARAFCERFLDHYNHVHATTDSGPYASIGALRHRHQIRAARADTLTAAYNANPARVRHRPPTPPELPRPRGGSTKPTEKHSSNPRKRIVSFPLTRSEGLSRK